jgi:hypothetical protein
MPIRRDDLVLYNGLEIESDSHALSELKPAELEACKTIVAWTRNFLCRPHELLGREGPVCPFTQPSLSHHLFWLTVLSGSTIDSEKAADTVERLREWFF